MTATILPFPLVRRRDFLKGHAGRLADAQPKTAEKLLAHAITVPGKALETAIRFELWRLTILGDTA